MIKWTSKNGTRYEVPNSLKPYIEEIRAECGSTEHVFLGQHDSDKYRKKAAKKLKKARVTLVDDISFRSKTDTGLARGEKGGKKIKAVAWDMDRAASIMDVPPNAANLRDSASMVKFSGGNKYWLQWAAYWIRPWNGVNLVLLHEFNHFWGSKVGHSQSVDHVLQKKFGKE